jgi:hypothetical protein
MRRDLVTVQTKLTQALVDCETHLRSFHEEKTKVYHLYCRSHNTYSNHASRAMVWYDVKNENCRRELAAQKSKLDQYDTTLIELKSIKDERFGAHQLRFFLSLAARHSHMCYVISADRDDLVQQYEGISAELNRERQRSSSTTGGVSNDNNGGRRTRDSLSMVRV